MFYFFGLLQFLIYFRLSGFGLCLLVHRSVAVLLNSSFAKVQKHGDGECHIAQEHAWIVPCISSFLGRVD